MTRKTHFIPPWERYGLSREEAAEYVGVSPTTFDEMVNDGRMPKPKKINSRNVWARHSLEAYFNKLPDHGAHLTPQGLKADAYSIFTA